MTDAATGLPIADVDMDAETQNGPGFYSHARTDSDGRFTLLGLAPGVYQIRASADDQGYIREFYDNRFDWDDADLVTVIGPGAIEGVVISLRLGATISGRVSDAETGLPISEMQVGAGPVNDGSISWSRTNRSGNYTLRGLPDGDIEVVVSGQGYVEVRRIATIMGGHDIAGFDF